MLITRNHFLTNIEGKKNGMNIIFKKENLIVLYACCRQAERSIHMTLAYDECWEAFQAFYAAQRRMKLVSTIGELRRVVIPHHAVVDFEHVSIPLGWLFVFEPFRQKINKWRTAWRVSIQHAQFIATAMERFATLLDEPRSPSRETRLRVRTDLSGASWLLRSYLIGVHEMRVAHQVEHFSQPEHMTHISIDNLLNCLQTGR